MEVKTCKQCGELKPIGQFRKYYGGRKGTYKMCKACESINSREKYLVSKGDALNQQEEAELDKIHTLWDYQRKLGLQPPGRQERKVPLSNELDGMLDKYKCMAEQVTSTTAALHELQVKDVPKELLDWLVTPLTEDPDQYIDDIYETLVETYRPCIGIDRDTMMPVYDNKYKAVLDKILERFTDYEDSYYEGDE